MDGDIYWDDLCGSQPFWSYNLTINSTQPDLPPCFQDSVLTWTPVATLWLSCLFYVPYLTSKPVFPRRHRTSKQLLAKLLIGLLLLLLELTKLTYGVLYYSEPLMKVKVITSSLQVATWILVMFVMYYEYKKGVASSGAVYCYWLLLLVLGVLPFRSYIIQYSQESTDLFWLSTFYIGYCLALVEFGFHSFADTTGVKRHETKGKYVSLSDEIEKRPLIAGDSTTNINPLNPELSASFLSRLTFTWVAGLVKKGWRRPLVDIDLWALRPQDTCKNIISDFYSSWLKSSKLKNSRCSPRKTSQHRVLPKITDSSPKYATFSNIRYTSLDQDADDSSSVSSAMSAASCETENVWACKSSVLMSLCRSVGGYFMLIGTFEILTITLTFIRPQLLDVLIGFIESGDPLVWHGYVYVALFFVINIAKGLVSQQAFYGKYIIGLRVRSALTSAVYRKSLRLSCNARNKYSVGEITNMMQVDAQRIADASFFVHALWTSPANMIVAMVLLWGYLGPSALAGLATLLLLIIINAVIVLFIKFIQFMVLRLKDERTKLTNEILTGIKLIKLYAWENAFIKRLTVIRNREITLIRKCAYLLAGTAISFSCCPIFYAVTAFTAFVLTSGADVLTPSVAFVSLTLVNSLTAPLSALPNALATMVQAAVSIKRLDKFLNEEELDDDAVTKQSAAEETAVNLECCTFSWDDGSTRVLRDINMKVKRGKLVAVVGQVGSGKSSLLSAILGDLYKVRGQLTVAGTVAYVPQEAWIRNETLEKNILFGKNLRKNKYDSVLAACALTPDLEMLAAGDQTEIGEKGINLSGGQKQRVSVARAVYQDRDIYLLDDPLSAVDAHVGKHIFKEVVGPDGLLRNKTRVLVTHGVTFLPHVDEIVVIKNGEISEKGTYRELLDHDGPFAEFIKTFLTEHAEEETDGELDPEEQKLRKQLRKQISVWSEESHSEAGSTSTRSTSIRRRPNASRSSRSGDRKSVRDAGNDVREQVDTQKLIGSEQSEAGGVEWSIVASYIRAGTTQMFVGIFVSCLIALTLDVTSTIWLSLWSDDTTSADPEPIEIRLGVYGALGVAQGVTILFHVIFTALATTRASVSIHQNLLDSVIHAPMSFFDTTPTGRILNRFSQDMNILDSLMRLTLFVLARGFVALFSVLVGVTYTTPTFLAVALPLGICYYFIQRFYIVTSNQLRRLQSVRTSPIYSHFGETITGASSIRAYNRENQFIEKCDQLIDEMQMARYGSLVANRWLSVSLEILGSSIVLFSALFAVLSRDTITGGLVGLSISYSLQVTDRLSMVVQNLSDLETNIVAVERINEYSNVKPEAAWSVESQTPSRSWPDQGSIRFSNYSTRYRPGLDLILKDINIDIQPGEKLGVVGRTGAGKSSMMLGLFRLIEAAGGQIIIDGMDTGLMGLHVVRGRLTIIPQDPVMFSGSLRFNLDPFEKHTDEEVWRAITQAHLSTFVMSLPAGLDYICSEGGQNLSIGQRQLLCLARALLRKSKILVLDEATAAVDMETDDLIQTTIHTEFSDSTVLTIAHRLNTVLDYNRIMVLEEGKIKELGKPSELMSNKQGVFYSMAHQAGLAH